LHDENSISSFSDGLVMAARPDEKFNKRITGCPGDGVRRKQIVNLPDRYTRWASKETVYLAAAAAAA
jgi:hypothetical protein